MFWALIMEPYKRYTQCVQHSFHVSMASLDTSLAEETPVQVMVNYKERNFLLCTLKKNKMWQIPLDLNFEKGTNLTFLCNGRGPVHLTGYLLPTYDSNSEGSSTDISISSVEAEEEKELSLEEGEEEKEQSLEQEEAPIEKHLKRKAESPKSGKKVKQAKKRSFSESNNQDSEENSRFLKEDADSDEDMEDEEVEEDEDDDDEKKTEQQKQKIKQRIRQDLASLQEIQKSEKKEIENQQQHQQKKKHDKQNKINGEEIQQEQQSKKQKKKVEQHTQQIDQNEAKKRIVEGGVQVEDIKSGNGALATSGKLLTVYYVGRCKIGSQQKKIDSCLQGNGFKFRLGKGQVIKGWDVGLVGMKVGGKRRLTIPSHMGYGAKGSPPTIPGNSTLVFDIELKNVN